MRGGHATVWFAVPPTAGLATETLATIHEVLELTTALGLTDAHWIATS